MSEKPKRLTPKPKTVRELFLKSGNLCAFPNCGKIMMNAAGEFIAELCHIEAAGPEGERFNLNMTNEQRRAFKNLMLMCHEHHVVTNNVKSFTVKKLQEMKHDHESRFSDPERAILESLIDVTTATQPVRAANLLCLGTVLKLELTPEQLSEAVGELSVYIERFRFVPIDVRRFVGAVATRMHLMRKESVVHDEMLGRRILIEDVKGALKLSRYAIDKKLTQLSAYGLGGLDHIPSSLRDWEPAIRINSLKSGWDLWVELAAFCKATSTPIARFSENLDFSALDASPDAKPDDS